MAQIPVEQLVGEAVILDLRAAEAQPVWRLPLLRRVATCPYNCSSCAVAWARRLVWRLRWRPGPAAYLRRSRAKKLRNVCRLSDILRQSNLDEINMIYLIGGAPRTGKSILGQRIAVKLRISWISTDLLKEFLL